MQEGFTRIPNKLITSKKLTSIEKLVCIVLVAYRMDNKDCFPSRNTISENSSLNIKTIDKAIRGLVSKKFIKKLTIIGRSNTYILDDILKIK